MNIAHCILAHCTLHTAHCSLRTAHCTLHTAHCKLHTAHCTLHTAYCKLHTAHCTLHTAHYSLLTAHCTLHAAQCTLHAAHGTLHTAHLTLHTAHMAGAGGACLENVAWGREGDIVWGRWRGGRLVVHSTAAVFPGRSDLMNTSRIFDLLGQEGPKTVFIGPI